jgi:hypothetical protein
MSWLIVNYTHLQHHRRNGCSGLDVDVDGFRLQFHSGHLQLVWEVIVKRVG